MKIELIDFSGSDENKEILERKVAELATKMKPEQIYLIELSPLRPHEFAQRAASVSSMLHSKKVDNFIVYPKGAFQVKEVKVTYNDEPQG